MARDAEKEGEKLFALAKALGHKWFDKGYLKVPSHRLVKDMLFLIKKSILVLEKAKRDASR